MPALLVAFKLQLIDFFHHHKIFIYRLMKSATKVVCK